MNTKTNRVQLENIVVPPLATNQRPQLKCPGLKSETKQQNYHRKNGAKKNEFSYRQQLLKMKLGHAISEASVKVEKGEQMNCSQLPNLTASTNLFRLPCITSPLFIWCRASQITGTRAHSSILWTNTSRKKSRS